MAGTHELPLVFLSVTKPSHFFPDELAVHCVKLTLHFVYYTYQQLLQFVYLKLLVL